MNSKSIEASGKTLDAAISSGLGSLDCTLDEVNLEILQEGSKGLFGIGSKDYIVRLTKKSTPKDVAVGFILGLCEKMSVEVSIDAEEDDEQIRLNMSGPNMGVLIGHRGETLDALQYLISLVINGKEHGKRVLLDTENYRKKREESLERLARKLASKVRTSGRPVSLEPMTPYERRILHATLQSNPYVTTASEGTEPNRKVVIFPK